MRKRMSTEKNDARLELRLPASVFKTLEKIEKTHEIKPQDLLRHLASKVAVFYDKNGWFSFPVTITPEHFQNGIFIPEIDKAKLGNEESGQKLPRAAQKEIADAQVTNRLSVEPPSPIADRIRAKQSARGAKK